jgi:hypothetical protein
VDRRRELCNAYVIYIFNWTIGVSTC